MESGLESQLELLKQLEESIDNCNNKLNELTKTEDISQKIDNNLDPKSRAEIHWACAYGTYTSYYLYLLLNEIHPKDHQLNKEIKRLQDFKEKIKKAVKGEEETEKDKKSNKRKEYEKKIKNVLLNSK